MSKEPIICFGQQPCGFFPRRFLVAKIMTARRLQKEIGGRIVFFYHDSDHDPRETQTILRHKKTGEESVLNFTFENKIQRKFSPLYCKRIPKDWLGNTARQLGAYVDADTLEMFRGLKGESVGDFCLDAYRAMGLLDGIEVVRSGAESVRSAACEIEDFFVDLPHQGEIVRARRQNGELLLHEGGNAFVKVPCERFEKRQISPSRDSRLKWMQSVIGCTHYVCGAGEQAYLRKEEAPEIAFVARDTVDRSDEAYLPHVGL